MKRKTERKKKTNPSTVILRARVEYSFFSRTSSFFTSATARLHLQLAYTKYLIFFFPTKLPKFRLEKILNFFAQFSSSLRSYLKHTRCVVVPRKDTFQNYAPTKKLTRVRRISREILGKLPTAGVLLMLIISP